MKKEKRKNQNKLYMKWPIDDRTWMFTIETKVGALFFVTAALIEKTFAGFWLAEQTTLFLYDRLFSLEFMAGNVGCLLFNNSINACCDHSANVNTAFASLVLETV